MIETDYIGPPKRWPKSWSPRLPGSRRTFDEESASVFGVFEAPVPNILPTRILYADLIRIGDQISVLVCQ